MAGESTLARELRAEQAYVDKVVAELGRAVSSAKGLALESRARYSSQRDTWLREEDGTALFERDAFAFLAARRMADLDGEHEGLVFGRLDFRCDEPRYIGRLGVRTSDYEPLVIDWRAQAAEPFYRATPIHPMDVLRRRVLTSRDDKVIAVEDDVLMPDEIPDDMAVIGDGALMKALGRARGTRMHDIVPTIQAEQDEIIRAPYQGFTIISGGPGTGKTVVGLHRIAYLLYTNRRRLVNGGVLIVGPSGVFMDYIERVLPSLGEDAVTLRSVGAVADDVLGFHAEDRDDAPVWAIKGSSAMATLLRRLVQTPPIHQQLTVMIGGEPLTISADELADVRRDALKQTAYNDARQIAEDQIVVFFRHAAPPDLADHRFEDRVRDSWAFTSFMEKWWPRRTPGEVLGRLRDPGLAISLGMSKARAELLASSINPEHWMIGDIPLLDELAEILGPTSTDEDPDPLFLPGDVTEIVTIADRLTDTRVVEEGVPHSTYTHILVDEAQDITPMQWRMIHRRGPNASWTILSDLAQSSWPNRDDPVRMLNGLIRTRRRRDFTLSTNYRSPKESSDLASAYIRRNEPDAHTPQAVRSVGIPPRLLVVNQSDLASTLAAQVSGLLTEVEGTVGVIAVADRLATVRGSLPDNARVVALDPFSAKGLEFDAVVVVDPDSIAADGPSGPRTLYVALTRPTQILVTLDIGKVGGWREGL